MAGSGGCAGGQWHRPPRLAMPARGGASAVARWPASYGGARGGRWGSLGALESNGGGAAPAASCQAAVADGVVVDSAQGESKQRLATTAAPDSGFKAGGSLPSPRRSPHP
jgi:hypothetical protein